MTTRNCGHGSLGEWNPCPMCEIKRLEAENAELKAERRKFTECTSSNGCFDHDGNLHVHNGDFMSPSGTVGGQIFPRVAKTVWHKEGE